MRIAQIMLAKGFGGAERSFVDISRELAGAGHEVLAVVERRSAARPLLEAVPGLRLACLRVLGPWDRVAGFALRRALAGFAPDVVHAHLARAAHLGGRAARSLGLPSLAKTHNYVDLRYYRSIDHLVATTEDQRRYLHEHGRAAVAVSVIPNFSRCTPAAAPKTLAGPPALLSYGRFVDKKGYAVLLEALALLRARDLPFTCTIGGDGPLAGELRRRSETLGLADRVRFPGWLGDVDEALGTHDAFVLPSLDEPFGIVLLEAMAHGLPIVATSTQGPREILDAATALLVPPGDPAVLAEALASLTSDPAAARERAGIALERFRSRYHVDAVLPRYLGLYERLAGARKPS